MASAQVSLVVPTFWRRESVQRLVRALELQSVPPESFEVLIVIDGSQDGTKELLATLRPPFRLRSMWQPNRGRAAACNAGIRAAQGDLVVLLDDDMEPATGFLAAHCRAHEGQPCLGVLGAVPVVVTAESPPVTGYIAARFEQHLGKLSRPGYQLNLRDFYSGNFSIRRQILLDAGLFDEQFTAYGNEDLELSLRLRRAGVTFVYCHEALAHQHYEKDFAALVRDNMAKARTALLFARMYPEVFSELKLGSYNRVSIRWRILRAALIQLSRFWRGLPEQVMSLLNWLERKRPAKLHLYYELALDYFYWWQVSNEL